MRVAVDIQGQSALLSCCFRTLIVIEARSSSLPPPSNNVRETLCCTDHLVGLVVKASASRAEDPGFESRVRRDFSGVESYQ